MIIEYHYVLHNMIHIIYLGRQKTFELFKICIKIRWYVPKVFYGAHVILTFPQRVKYRSNDSFIMLRHDVSYLCAHRKILYACPNLSREFIEIVEKNGTFNYECIAK